MNLRIRNKSFLMTILPLIVLFLSINVSAQTPYISPTNTQSQICGRCAPTNWTFVTGSTPDVSNRNNAGGQWLPYGTGGNLGYGAPWAVGVLPTAPTGHSSFISLRDVGPNFDEESISTTISGLLPNKLYRLTMYTISPLSTNGGNNTEYYAGTKMNQFDYSITANSVEQARQNLNILSSTAWNATYFVFKTPAVLDGGANDSVTLNLYPKQDGNYNRSGVSPNTSIALETVLVSIDNTVAPITRLDTDGDGIPDDVDIDDDNDGILDTVEYPSALDHEGDEDGDGVPNYLDANDNGVSGNIGTNYADLNGDGLPDAFDFDHDGVPNHVDLDSDNDGILDIKESQPSTGAVALSGSDDDNDGLDNNFDATPTQGAAGSNGTVPTNTDGDLSTLFKPDFLDIDADNDGIPDIVEAHSTSDYKNSLPSGTIGKNGVDSKYVNVDTYSPTAVTAVVDTDLDSTPDYRDSDSDNDGTSDLNESGLGNTLSGTDSDGDGLDDNQDTTDAAFTSGSSNFDATNTLTNTETDLAETETPNDVTTGGDVDFRDSVTGIDTDGDGVPDITDLDDDNDGILDSIENVGGPVCSGNTQAITSVTSQLSIGTGSTAGLNNGNVTGDTGMYFSDNQTYAADIEVFNVTFNESLVVTELKVIITAATGTYPDSFMQTGLQYRVEGSTGGAYTLITGSAGTAADNTAPVSTQYPGSREEIFDLSANTTSYTSYRILWTGGGGIAWDPYIEEIVFTANPCIAGGKDTDGDGIIDSLDIDSDNDGITDNVEAQTTTGYIAPNSDSFATYATNNGVNSAYLGGSAITPVNTDNGASFTNKDDKPDYLDIDSDNDGIPDNIEAQTTTGYVNFVAVAGSDKNGLSSAYDFSDNFTAVGLSNTLVNTDGDSEPDYRDQDSDGDSTNDSAEGLSSITAGSFGTDTDNDGLDDIYEHGSTNDGFVVNDGIANPKSSGLIDGDGDVLTGGDVDYRDGLAGTDTDGDGIIDSVDIDDDNDGILDTVENGCGDETTPTAYWTLDNNTNDVSGNGHNERTGLGTSPSYSTTAIQGTHSASFNGTSDIIRYSQNGGFQEQPYTNVSFSAWIMPTSVTGTRIIHEEGGGTNGMVIWLNGGTLSMSARLGGSGMQTNITHPTTLTVDNLWHHIAATFNNGVMIVYIDGVASSSATAGFNNLGNHTDDGGLGGQVQNANASGITGFYAGLMDAVRYSNSETWTQANISFDAKGGCDFDGDGIINSLDLDSDGDGILDIIESQPSTGANTLSGNDADNDGLDDNFDATPNGNVNGAGSNGTTPTITTATDTTPDYLDIDADDDGIPDNIEAQSTQGYTPPTGNVGLNGVDSAYESNDTFNPTGVTIPNTDTTLSNNADTIPDYRDTDSDGDGTLDNAEGLNPTPTGTLGTDTDGDGLDDVYENGSNNDGPIVNDGITSPVNTLLDADSDGSTTGDVDYRDISVVLDNDNDGIIDSIDLDDDNDGILDTVEGTGDFDSDGIIDSFDIDADNDGIPDNIEAQSTTGYIAPNADSAATYITNNGVNSAYLGGVTPQNTDAITGNNNDADPDYKDLDSDGDGTIDRLEAGFGTAASGLDADNDGLDDVFEHGSTTDGFVVNDGINTPISTLPDEDSDAAVASTNSPAANYNDLDYRDIDDDRTAAVTPGHVLWLRADIGLTGSTWEDQTGAGATKFDATPSNSPTINTSGTNALNFNPTVTFNGTNQRYSIGSGGIFGSSTNNDVLWIYAVSLRETGDGDIFGHDLAGNDIVFRAPDGGDFAFNPGTGNTITNAWGGTDNKFHLWNAGYDNNTDTPNTPLSVNNTILYRDGRQIDTDTNTGNYDGNGGSAFIGSDTNNNFMDGQIAELMVYTSIPTSAEQQQIQSYLAIKYGITLDNIVDNDASIIEGDYTLLDGTKVWNISLNSAYHNDVAGIGREDGMLLTQKQSKSINSDAVITIGLNSIATSNALNSGAIANQSFLMWGNNGATLTNTSSSTIVCTNEKQLDRVWKVVETGSIGTVQVGITTSTLSVLNSGTATKFLKIADDANFTTNVKQIPLSTSGSLSVANFDFNGTKYFTYSEIDGIFWNGDANAWTGGDGTNNAPSELTNDASRVLVIDGETTNRSAILTSSATVGCVWIKANSKLVINNDKFIKFGGKLILDGEIRLIGDAQLVQTHTGVSNVEGTGKLYRDQKSYLPSIYRYNYWTSPVVKSLGNTSYKVGEVMHDGTAATSENSTTKSIVFKTYAQVSDLNGEQTDPIKIGSYWIFSMFNGVTRDDWVQKGHLKNINVAEGYLMKSTGRSPQNFTFMGTPNDGDYIKTLTANTSSLLGNPYPSVIDTQKFITANTSSIDGTLYFWEHKGESTTTSQVEGHGEFGYIGGYSQRNQAMGVAASSVTSGTAGLGESSYTSPPQFIAIGQGFFVSATSTGGNVVFKNDQRAYSANNIFFKGQTNDNLPNFKLGFDYTNNLNAKIHRQLGINFKAGNTFKYESGFDSQTFDLQTTDVYWNFSEVESNLIIAGIGELSAQLQVPLGIVIDTDKPVTLMIDEKDNMDGYAIYLVDLLTGQIFNLNKPKVLNLAKGTYKDRFVLIFGGTALGVDDEALLNKVSVFSDNVNNEVVIKNNNNQVIDKVELYNLLGQKVKTWKNIETKFETRISTNNLASSIYIVKVFTDKGISSKKISINNN
jgi:hypothetical protein